VKTALITGIAGQDGSFLAELLIEKGYEVHGIVRRTSSLNTARLDHLYTDPHDGHAKLTLHYGDLGDSASLVTILRKVQPDEIYHLGAQSHVQVSFELPEYTSDVTGTARSACLMRSAPPASTPASTRLRLRRCSTRLRRRRARLRRFTPAARRPAPRCSPSTPR